MSVITTLFADVLLPLPLQKYFTYRIPLELNQTVKTGMRVVVPFGKKKLYTGIVVRIGETPPTGYEAKYISEVLDEEQIISESMLRFWEWLASYYLCTNGDVMQAALPAAFKPESQTVVCLHPDFKEAGEYELSDQEYLVTEALTLHNQLKLEEISDILQIKNVFPVIRSLFKKEVLLIREDLEQRYKPKLVQCVRMASAHENEEAMNLLFNALEKKQAQTDLLMAYLVLKQESNLPIEKSKLLLKAGVTDSPLKTMVSKGIFEVYTITIDRLRIGDTGTEIQFKLNTSQENAFQQIKSQFEQHDVVLMHGVTSSGKTHIYVKLIEEQLAQNKQVLYLLPEIALTSHIVERIRTFFGDQAMAFHSRFSQNERVELWQKVRKNEIKVIIGARSSVFLPFENLGLVIVDEEHESSFKQHEPAPRYHARDAAIYLAKLRKGKILLGSATPSFESYYNAQHGKYGFVHMAERFGEVALPHLVTANLAEENRVKTMHGSLTSVLYKAIKKTIEAGEQVILFQNRRGYAPVLECGQCHHVPRCKNCDISLTYHKYSDSLKCHYCGYTMVRMKSCVSCGSHLLDLKGIGTEKIEDELSAHFPEARVARLDLDSVRGKNGHHEILSQFEAGEADILVGTQMLSKGLDFGNVSLVGVINADQLLHYPDFRAYERAYQMLTQVSGRAGRKQKQGLVIIQTSQPDHHVIQEVIHQRYEMLYANSLNERKEYFYPPYSRLIKLFIKHADLSTTVHAANDLHHFLARRLGPFMVGPEAPPVSRIRNQYIMEILVKIDRESAYLSATKQFIREGIKATLEKDAFKRVYIYGDVDPN